MKIQIWILKPQLLQKPNKEDYEYTLQVNDLLIESDGKKRMNWTYVSCERWCRVVRLKTVMGEIVISVQGVNLLEIQEVILHSKLDMLRMNSKLKRLNHDFFFFFEEDEW